jgi:hypothetical protein
MNSDSDMRIMFAGVDCRPMPARRIEKAMTKRGKLVTMIRMPGATERTVSRPKVRMIHAATEPSTGRFNRFDGSCCACASSGTAIMAAKITRNRIIR